MPRPVSRQRIDTVVHPRAQGRPGAAVPFGDAVGRISAVTVTAYPPSIPIILPGEVISREHLEYINRVEGSGGKIIGIKNGLIGVVES